MVARACILSWHLYYTGGWTFWIKLFAWVFW